MPYTSDHKAATRARIVESARRLFNRRGFEQVSIEQIMAGAGLTRGGFYHHFGSKDQLYAETVASFSRSNPYRQRAEQMADNDPVRLARMLIDVYLSDEVLADVDMHCPLYALPSDVARAGLSPQKAYTALVERMTALYRKAMPESPAGAERAQAIVALCVGGMVLARTTDDPQLCTTLRAAARRQALALLDS